MKKACGTLAALCVAVCGQAQTAGAPVADIPVPSGLHDVVGYTSIVFNFVPRTVTEASWERSIGADRAGTYRVLGSEAAVPMRISISEATWTRLGGG